MVNALPVFIDTALIWFIGYSSTYLGVSSDMSDFSRFSLFLSWNYVRDIFVGLLYLVVLFRPASCLL